MSRSFRHHYKVRRYRVRTFKQEISRFFKLLLVLVILAVFVYGGYSLRKWLFTSSVFNLREIVVKGAGQLAVSEIISRVPWRLGENIFTCKLSSERRNLLRFFPRIEKVWIYRMLPDKIVIKIKERQPVCRILEANFIPSCRGVDRNGVCFELTALELQEYENGPFLLLTGQKDVSELKPLLEFTGELKKMYNNIWRDTYSLSMNGYGEITTVSKDGLTICWGKYLSTKDLFAKVQAIKNVQEKSLGRGEKIKYLDLNLFGLGRIIVRPAETTGAS